MRIAIRCICLLLAVWLVAGGCSHQTPTQAKEGPELAAGFRFKVGPGQESAGAGEPGKVAQTTDLSEAATAALLKRLQPIKTEADDQKDFALREKSLPPPKTGKTISQPFPPPESKATPDPKQAGPLTVLRYAPEGDVPLAPHLSVTFSQPMVPISSIQEIEAKTIPVKLTPTPKGKWRWVGAQTLLFEPDPRFPMATEYQVEVPAGTTSETGGKLESSLKFSFRTPPPKVIASYPTGGPQTLKPLMFLAFDQAIDTQAVFRNTKLVANDSGKEAEYPLRLAEPGEIALNEAVRNLVDGHAQDRVLVLATQQALPAATGFFLRVGKGTPSAEGPLTTTEVQSSQFSTYSPLRITDSSRDPRPFQGLYISFNNPLDAEKFDPSMVTVKPEIPNLKVAASGSTLVISGRTKGRTRYVATVKASLPDDFSQTLGKDQDVIFNVGPAEQAFSAVGGEFQVLDPGGPPKLPILTVNHPSVKVKAWAVQPSDFEAFKQYYQQSQRDIEKEYTPPGRQVINDTIQLKNAQDELVETPIDLSKGLPEGTGQLVVVIEPTQQPKEKWNRRRFVGWLQATRIGLTAMQDGDQMVAWATRLDTGEPLSGVEVELAPGGVKATTGPDGTARLALPAQGAAMLLARSGQDLAMLPQNVSMWGSSNWYRSSRSDRMAWYVVDDRRMYRPGETVHIKGWVRNIEAGPRGGLGSVQGCSLVTYTLTDSQGNEIGKGTAPVTGLAGFEFQFALPKTVNLGSTQLTLSADGSPSGATTHTIEVQEFRRPEFEVSASTAEGACFVGQSTTVSVSASYYAGGGLPNAEVNWNVSSSQGSYSPPGWSGYTFGVWRPWWDYRCWWLEDVGSRRSPEYPSQNFTGRTDANGKNVLKLDFESINPPSPTSVTAQATVQDVNRQAWTATTSVLVHPSDQYVGMKAERTFVEQGQPLPISLIACDLDGKPVVGRSIELKAYRLDWAWNKGRMESREVDVTNQTVTSLATPVTASLKTGEGGTYQIEAYITDDKGRKNRSQLTMWVAGGKVPPSRNVEQEQVTLVPDKQEYKPGEVAEILVQSPFQPAFGLLTTRREGLVKQEFIRLDKGSTTLKIPLEEAYIPNLQVQVDLVGSAERTLANGEPISGAPRRPSYGVGTLNLQIPPKDRHLTVELKPAATALEPGGQTDLKVVLKDASGQVVPQGEVAVVMVDEAILALSGGYRWPDPLNFFYPGRGGGVSDFHLRQYVLLSRPEELNEQQPMPEAQTEESFADGIAGGAPRAAPAASRQNLMAKKAKAEGRADSKDAEAPSEAIKVRTNFNPVAFYAGNLTTDAQGTVTVPVKLPDNLTRYRIMAVASAGTLRFGSGDASLTARLPLMVRPSAPRFLNFGDRCELPVVVQNQTDQSLEVEVGMRCSNAKLQGAAGKKLTVPANDRLEVRFPVETDRPGTARFQVAAAAGTWSDAAEVAIPVWTPATTEAFATYGTVDEGAVVQSVQAPKGVFPQFGGLDITTSSTAVQELTDAFLYLQHYPFECSEQISSRVLSVAALRDVLTAFKAAGTPTPKEIEASMAHDLERLKGQQNYDGGFDFWVRGRPSIPYLSVHVGHALARAKQKGYTVDADMLAQMTQYLRTIESHIPADYPESCKRAIRAYALYVRHLLNDSDPAKARALVAETGVDKLPLESAGWLLPTLNKDKSAASTVAAILRLLDNKVTETASTAQFATSYGDGDYLLLYSDRRVDAVLLEALIEVNPKNDVIPKLVRGLLDHRTAGRWGNTQENCFVLLALDRYFNTYEKVTPNFVARVWLGDAYAGEQTFKGRSVDKQQIKVPMSWLKGTQNLILDKQGAGRMYYRIGMDYAPTDLKMPPYEAGFTVERTYQPIKDNRDVTRDKDGVWHIKAGSEVRVRLTMVAPARRYHVALVDPLPAGLEAVNPALAVSQESNNEDYQDRPSPRGGRGHYWWWGPWYQHQNLRDERVEAFTTLLWEGVYTYSYVARATTPGNFVVPATKAEEMYHPETFGRGATDRVIVE